MRTTRATQVEVARFAIVECSRPEGANPPPLVAPGTAESSRPALVGEDCRGPDLRVVVAVLGEGAAGRLGGRDDAEAGVLDPVERESAPLEVGACLCAAVAEQLAPGELEEGLEQFAAAIDAGADGQLFDDPNEVGAAGGGAAVHVRGPEHRLAAVDEKALRLMGDDAVGTGSEPDVRGLVMGG